MFRRSLAAALALAASACAPAPRFGRLPHLPRAAPAARFRFVPGTTDTQIDRVARAMPSDGLRLAERDELKVVTQPRERDVPCGASTCLAREIVRVKFGWTQAALRVERWIWSAGTRSWERPLDPASLADIAREQELLLADLLRPRSRLAPEPERADGAAGPGPAAVAAGPSRLDGGAGGG
jgi:hypothetical protein